MNTRLQRFLDAENITQAQFADTIKVARAGVSHIIAGRNRPGSEFLISTMAHYPDLNIEWLLTGKGRMYKNSGSDERQPALPDLFSQSAEEETAPEPEISMRESQNHVPEYTDAPDIAATGRESVVAKEVQQPVKQRKAVKIMVFYDDGTFQEF